MRVLSIGNMYPPHHLGGYELMWRAAVEHLRERGDEVRVLTTDFRLDRPDPAIAEYDDVHRELRWYWKDHAFPRIGLRQRLGLERHNRRTLRRHLGSFQPDVVAWWAMGGMSLSLIEAVRRAGIPAVGMVHDDWMVYGPQLDAWQRAGRRAGALRPLVGMLSGVPTRVELGSAATWAFVSETIRRHALESGLQLESTTVASSGVDRGLFRQRPERPWSGRLLYVGRIDERKGIQTAIRALALLPEATLTVIGSGDEAHGAALRALVAELGVQDRVSFAERRRDQLPDAYAEADAVLFPVLWDEPWGLVPLEAMAVGRPVVATGAGGSGEYLRHEENCLIFEPRDDPEALARAVERLVADERLRRRLLDNGFATAERWDVASLTERVGALIDAVVE